MIIAWLFGLSFGLIAGFGGSQVKEYNRCLNEAIHSQAECKEIFQVKDK
jgi:hypothetical protein